MDRKDFIRKSALVGVLGITAPAVFAANKRESTYDKLIKNVGFNHLPNSILGETNKEELKMKTILHKANTRGIANHGWLNSHHSFSFANYYNPERMHFGALRVLNDDIVAPGMGFGKHPHDNMEIISIPLEGDLLHNDSMGTTALIKEGDVQVMSAGTGIAHSEFNKNKDKEVKFLQIWVFPRERDVTPRYDQISLEGIKKKNTFYQIVSPNKSEQGVWINQDAWFYLGDYDAIKTDTYTIHKKGNGVYLFVIEGEVEVGGQKLAKRDGLGIWDVEHFDFKINPEKPRFTNGSAHVILKVQYFFKGFKTERMILDKLKWRYATKKFDVERRVSEENIQRLKEAIQLAPSSYGLQPLKVLIITNKELREQLKPLSWNQPQITEASHLFVFCNKTNVAEQEINALIALKAETLQRSPENFKGYGDFILSKMKEKSSLEQSVWTAKQAYIAMSNLIMACAALEIDSCPMEGFEQEAYNKILKLNEQGCAAAVVVAVGYRDVSDAGQHMPKVRKSFSDLFTRLD